MEDTVKQRLLGAVVIIGLAIIFLPAILDREEDSSLAVTMEIPPRPQIVKNIDIEKALDKKKAQFDKEVIEPPKPLVVEPEKISQKKPSQVIEEIKAKAPVAKKVDKPKPSTAEPIKTNSAATTEVWVVQLGSFSKQENAQKLKQKLAKDYKNLYIEKVQIPGGNTYRLRLGDFTNKDLAIQQRRKIKSQHDISGVVMTKE